MRTEKHIPEFKRNSSPGVVSVEAMRMRRPRSLSNTCASTCTHDLAHTLEGLCYVVPARPEKKFLVQAAAREISCASLRSPSLSLFLFQRTTLVFQLYPPTAVLRSNWHYCHQSRSLNFLDVGDGLTNSSLI